MTRSTMKWLAPYLLALMALCSPARRAEAQLSTGINKVTIGTEELELKSKLNINAAQCSQPFVFEMYNVQPRTSFMEVWVTSTAGVDCNTQAARSNAIVGQKPQCWFTGVREQNVLGDYELTIPGNRIFDQDRNEECDANITDQPFWVYFVPLQTPTIEDTPMNSEGLLGPRFRAQFHLFSATPDPPSGIKVTGGERSVKVSWDGLADPTRGSQAFFDIAPEIVGDECTSSVLTGEGNKVVIDKVRVFSSGQVSRTSASLGDLQEKGVLYGGKVAVAVAQVDASGNIGKLSDVQCANIVETTSAIDACGTPEECGLETCGLSPASRGGWFGLSLFGLLLAALIRRRTA